MARNPLVFIALLACLVMLVPLVGQANSPTDTVDEDWVYFALAELGRGRSVAQFIIPQEMTRYQGALLVSRLIEYIDGHQPSASLRFGISREVVLDEMIRAYNQRAPEEQRLDEGEVELLYRLVLEFYTELEILGYDVQDYAIILGLGASRQLGGLFAERQLTYSSQALAAVLKAGAAEPQAQQGEVAGEETMEPSFSEDEDQTPEDALEHRSLWTGSLPISSSMLSARGTFVAEEEPKPSELGTLSIGGLQIGGAVRALESGAVPKELFPELDTASGYGLFLKYGDIQLSTMRDHYAVESQEGTTESQVKSTSLDLSLGLPNSIWFSAGYTYFDFLDSEYTEADVSAVATLGVEVPISTGGTLRLGMSSAWPRGAVGTSEGESHLGDPAVLSTAELGLSYDFENETSVKLNYRLIDFTTVNQSYGATAEFSIKF
ncbi:MAG: hypothetical protein ACOX48_06790 [Limnochordia bacterium]|jgi:hypothetical protein